MIALPFFSTTGTLFLQHNAERCQSNDWASKSLFYKYTAYCINALIVSERASHVARQPRPAKVKDHPRHPTIVRLAKMA